MVTELHAIKPANGFDQVYYPGELSKKCYDNYMAEGIPVVKVAFEVVSALATVGLSTGITPSLAPGSKFVLILLMLMGRVGIVTFAMALAMKKDTRQHYHHPMGKFTVG